jgi:NAD(P)-dependent dehydrogenase (short-subunit alcohol dehydrogenase family)
MREFSGKVAVVTGGASGIGLAMARKFARQGMRVVLADIENDALLGAEAELRAAGATVMALRTDVSRAEDIETLAAKTISTFGGVHILCNNAGVGPPRGPIWERTLDDWKWVMSVNLYGVIHGIRTFVPIMIQQGEEAHVVNTASLAGLVSRPSMGVYTATKHAVVSISEVLFAELSAANAPIGVSVLCPAFVSTRIMDSARNRPTELAAPGPGPSPHTKAMTEEFKNMIEAGMPPDLVAEKVFAAIQEKQLYILTHPEFNAQIRQRVEGILAERNPAPSGATAGS